MTREEAISLLSQVNHILVNSNSWLENTHEPLNIAYDMAIKALEQQPCKDTISRQAAIDAVRKSYDEILDFYSDGHTVADSFEDILNALPSAQPEIITCIDCIHYTPLGKDKAWGRCAVHSSPTENQRMCQSCDFCSWAERRTDG